MNRIQIAHRTKSITTVSRISSGMICRIVCVALVFAVVLAAPAAINVYTADNLVNITVRQIYSASSQSSEETFTYRLKPLNTDNPMPTGSTTAGYTFTITGSKSVVIGPISPVRDDVYRYELYQVVGTENPNYIYDKRVYTIEIYYEAPSTAYVVALNQNGAKANEIVFENSRKTLGANPTIKKTVTGNPTRDSVFTFRLVAHNTSHPMPLDSANGVKSINITGSGQGSFGGWDYSAAGVYKYNIYEVDTGVSGYTYDKTVYTITDSVNLESGRLTASRVIKDEYGRTITDIVFSNRYRSGGGGGGGGGTTKPPSVITPKPKPPTIITPIPKPTGSAGKTITPKPTRTSPPTAPSGSTSPKKTPTPAPPGGKDGPPVDNSFPPGNGYVDVGKPGGSGPKTGDEANTILYILLFVSGGVLVIGSLILMISGKKKNRENEYVISGGNKHRRSKQVVSRNKQVFDSNNQ